MPTEHAFDAVLRNFLEVYVRRNSDLGGSGLFGLLLRDWNGPLEFDLLGIPPPLIAESKTAVVAEARAIATFREQVATTGLAIDTVARATLTIDRSIPSAGGERNGFEVRFRASAEMRSGEAFAREAMVFVPPDPAQEMRGARATRRTGPDILALLLACVGLFRVAPAPAGVVQAMSLEWATDMSRWIGVYRIQEVDSAAEARWCDLTLRRVDTLAGQAPDTLNRREFFFEAYPKPGDSFLVFEARHRGEPMMISLIAPRRDPWVPAIDRDFRVHENPVTIRRLVVDRLERTRQVRDQPGWHDPGLVVPVPGSSEAHAELWSLSSVYLVVPPDALERAKLLASLDGDDWTTMRVACSLAWCYPEDPAHEILYRVIPDGSRYTWHESAVDTLSVPVRAIVARSLEQARGGVVSESYYPLADDPDPCTYTHVPRPD